MTFDSSTGFELPNGAPRSPDVASLRRSCLRPLTEEQKERFLPLCPDFVVELLSPSDSVALTQANMDEYLANGTQRGWLIDSAARRVDVDRPGTAIERLDDPVSLSAAAWLL